MNFSLPSTSDQEARARADCLRLLGIGAFAALFGLGAGVALYGYSTFAGTKVTAAMVSEAMSRTFEKVALKTEVHGSATLRDGVVSLKPDQKVTLSPGAAVALAPDASVRVTGEVDLSTVYPALRPGAAPKPGAKLITDYTVFKQVRFGAGSVHTGWKYDSNRADRPSSQYCYYAQNIDDSSSGQIHLGADGRMEADADNATIDVSAAFRNCVWFEGGL